MLSKQSLGLLLLSKDFCRDLSCALVLVSAQLLEVDLIWTISQLEGSDIRPRAGERSILRNTSGTERLDSTVDNCKSHVWHQNLGEGNLFECALGSTLINLDGGVEDDETCCINLDSRAGDPLEDDTVLLKLLAEWSLLWIVDAHQHPVESILSGTNGAHGVVNTSWAETTLDDLEPTAWAEDNVGDWNADIDKGDVAVTVWGVIVTVDRHHAVNGETWRVVWDKDNRLLLVDVLVSWIGLGHNDVDVATWVTGSRGPPFAAVQDPVVAIALHVHLNVGCIGGSNVWLSHEESRADLALHQWDQPFLLLCLVTVLGENLHVAGIWGGAVDSLRGQTRLSKVLSHQAVLEVSEAWRLLVVALWQEHVPEAELLGLDLQVIDDCWVGVLGYRQLTIQTESIELSC